MRLAVVRRRFDPCGGAELYLQRLLEALVGAGWYPEVIAESWSEQPGIRVHPVRVTGGRAVALRSFIEGAERLASEEAFDGILSLERGVRADVYRAGDGVHAEWVRNWRRWGRWWKRPVAGRGAFHTAMRQADARSLDPGRTRRVIVNSEMVRSEIHQNFRFPDERIHLVRNGVEVDRFKTGNRRRIRDHWSVPESVCLLLFAGSGWERKGLAWLRRALAMLPPHRFVLAAAGRGRPQRRPAINERYVGALPRSEMPDAYAAADVFVFPSLYDPCANACAEALAAGLPVITTRQNGAAELISDGVNGSVIDTPADTAALAAAIRQWAEHGAKRPVPVTHDLSLERNVHETLAVLELALKG